MNYIKRIRTPSGDKQIDYEALANLPKELPASADEDGNIVCKNGLKMFKDFSMPFLLYDEWVEDETHEDGGYYLTSVINGPFSVTVKVAEVICGLCYTVGETIKDGFSLEIKESADWEYVDEVFPSEYFDYEIQPAETITEEFYDLFCEGKFVLKSDGRVYSLNSELQDLRFDAPSNILESGMLWDDYEAIALKVIITSTVDKLKAYQEYLKSLENGGGEE